MPPARTVEAPAPEVTLRDPWSSRLFGALLWIGGLYLVVDALLTGELNLKLAVAGLALILFPFVFLGGLTHAYIVDGQGVRERKLPAWLSSREPYVLRWDRPVYAIVGDHGFLGKSLTLTNHESDDAAVTVMDGRKRLALLLREVRHHRDAFAHGRYEIAETFLVERASR